MKNKFTATFNPHLKFFVSFIVLEILIVTIFNIKLLNIIKINFIERDLYKKFQLSVSGYEYYNQDESMQFYNRCFQECQSNQK